MKRLLAAFARNTVFANIMLVLIFMAGGLTVFSMTRENFPEFSLDMILVNVPFPGADPEEVEEGVSRKIEEALEGVEGLKLIVTHSAENLSTTRIEVHENYDIDAVLDEVRTNINAISTFPVDAEKPVVEELSILDPVVLLYLSAEMSERRIKEWAEKFKDELQQLPEISRVTVFGTRDYEIGIEVSEERLRRYGLSFDQVAAAVRRSNLNMGGGTIRATGEEIRLRTMGRRYTDKELADIVVLAGPDGQIITLDRVADIKDDFSEDPIASRINGEPAVILNVFKTSEEDALAISKAVHAYVEERQAQLPGGINLEVLYDTTDMLQARINLMIKNGMIGMVIVFSLLYIFLNARLSFWGGMGIPISIAGAMVILWGLGATINMISLFGFIMVLGVVVDDAIVVGEAIYVHRKSGEPPLKAAVEGVSEVGMPVVAAVLTTIVAFLPLLYVGGIMGKFIAIMPVVVIACLAVSLVECLLLLPAHLSRLPAIEPANGQLNPAARRLERIHRATSSGMEWFVARVYVPFLKKALAWRYISLSFAIAILFISLGLVVSGILKFEVLPDIDGFIMTATVEYPSGTPADVTADTLDRIEAAMMRLDEKTPTLSGEPLIEERLTLVGQTLEDIPRTGPHLGSVQAILLDSERRGVHAKQLMSIWEQEIGPIPGIKALTFTGLSAGPPGDPIEVWIQGHKMADILAAADDLMARLQKFDGVYQIRSDFSTGKNEIRLTLKPEAHTLGLTVDDLARQIHAGYFGREALRLQRGRDDVRVKVRYTADERSNLAEGMPFFEALTAGGARRFRAIFLTTLSTVGGLAPLIMETDFQARFLIPMALSLAAGVAFATVMTLVLIPSLLAILNDLRRVARRMTTQQWPTREEVEPATGRRSSDRMIYETPTHHHDVQEYGV